MKTGFWEYTTPGGSGPVAWYNEKEWETLLNDMAEAQMDSIVLLIKWSSTGYKSSLPFDKILDCASFYFTPRNFSLV